MNAKLFFRVVVILILLVSMDLSATASSADSPIQTLAGTTERVSIATDGTQGNGESGWYGWSWYRQQSISADGRYVAFYSEATNLVNGDTNGKGDVFVHDRQTGVTTRVSVASDGTQGNQVSEYPYISGNGRFVAFESLASTLVSGDTNNKIDIFVHDLLTHQTTRVSIASDGTQANDLSYTGSLSQDGRYVAFSSMASNLVYDDTNLFDDIFVHDRLLGVTELVSVSSDGSQANSWSDFPIISADGMHVVFRSDADNLVAGDDNQLQDIFVHDRDTGATIRVSISSSGEQANDISDYPSISGNGRFVTFASGASNLVDGDTNDYWDVFLHDTVTHQTRRVSVASDGDQAVMWSDTPMISSNGRYIAFGSYSNNLVYGDINGAYDVFVHDQFTGQTTLASLTYNGEQGWARCEYPAISADGRFVAFDSYGSDFVPGDTNGFSDVFVRDRGIILTTLLPLINR